MPTGDEILASITEMMASVEGPPEAVTIWLGPADRLRLTARFIAADAPLLFGTPIRVCEDLEPGEIYSVPERSSIGRMLREVHEDWIIATILRMLAERERARQEAVDAREQKVATAALRQSSS
jgi:hypothetical protein